jgi:GalNAc5-diNAcBac-PP-undecaprenol beta-1,3-glucosyltransferase
VQPLVSVLVPTHDHATLLPHAVRSALRQTHPHLEVLIIGDGAGPDTVAAVEHLQSEDGRVRWLPLPKGPRLGEAYRHRILLEEARGEVIAYLTDDDLWFDDHLETLLPHLRDQPFVASIGGRVHLDQRIEPVTHDLQDERVRRTMLDGINFVPLPAVAHTLDAYRRLPHGWRTTPSSTYTDLYMWQQWIAHDPAALRSVHRATILSFTIAARKERSADERERELRGWADRLHERGQEVRQAIVEALVRRALDLSFDRPALVADRDRVSAARVAAEAEVTRLRDELEQLVSTRTDLLAQVEHLQATHQHYVRHVARIEAELEAERAARSKRSWLRKHG